MNSLFFGKEGNSGGSLNVIRLMHVSLVCMLGILVRLEPDGLKQGRWILLRPEQTKYV